MSAISENISINWITPEEQLMRLIPASKATFKSSMLRIKKFGLDQGLILMIMDYFVVEAKPQLANWYTALKRVDLMPVRIPALPDNICDILDGPCPIMEMGSRKRKLDPDKVFETHSLYLLPPGDLQDLQDRVQEYRYKASNYRLHGSFNLSYGGDLGFRQDGVLLGYWEWVLIPNTVIEKSRNKCYADQMKIVEEINQTQELDYKIASFKQMAPFLYLHKVATEENLYPIRDNANIRRSTYARVQGMGMNGSHLMFGGSDDFGFWGDIHENHLFHDSVGIAALRTFSQAWPSEI